MKIYLDNCTFNRPFDDQSQLKIVLETDAKLYIQKGILAGDYVLIWSYILEFENNQNQFDDKRNAIYDWKKIAKIHCVENDEIISYAENLKKMNIKTKDALHVACAVYTGADYMITTDKKLFKLKLNEINIVNPTTFLVEMGV